MVRIVASSICYGELDFETIFTAAMSDLSLAPPDPISEKICEESFEPHELARVSLGAKMGSAVLDHAWEKAQLSPHRNRLDGRGHRERDPRTALVVGSSLSMLDESLNYAYSEQHDPKPYSLSKLRGNALTAPLAIRFGIGGGTHLVSGASATGGQALVMAGNLIKTRQVERVAVVCLDHFTHQETRRLMHRVGAVTDNPHSKPLSENRSGMRPASASAAMILEADDSCTTRGIASEVSWVNGVIRNDCHHLVAPEPSNIALEEATKETLAQVGLEPTAIDWLSLHATGTSRWDALEAAAVRQIFSGKHPHLSAFKRTFGHTLGAAGLFEAIMLVEAMKRGVISDPMGNIDSSLGLTTTARTETARNTLMWSAGMGGDIAVNLFERHDV